MKSSTENLQKTQATVTLEIFAAYLKKLAELNFFFIGAFNGKKLHSIVPERQEMDLVI